MPSSRNSLTSFSSENVFVFIPEGILLQNLDLWVDKGFFSFSLISSVFSFLIWNIVIMWAFKSVCRSSNTGNNEVGLCAHP